MRASRGLDKAQIATLITCGWIDRNQNLIVIGPTGVGKTWIASAFAHQACRLRKTVFFRKASDLYGDIAVAPWFSSFLEAHAVSPAGAAPAGKPDGAICVRPPWCARWAGLSWPDRQPGRS